ncbi:RNA polymerase sigma factor [Labilibacter marinus]|uniref:RNA polymerase sigma factor n=1 Tax=Labilibacter marinus TaxID=1477105 RepID=UPI00094F52CA|nr:sigma-70 family RNA polymerase sigma factor [Labilibacter marinus]
MKSLAQPQKTDEVLIQDYYNGNSNSIETIYSRYYLKVFNKCLSFTQNPDDAFDFTQDIFIKAFSKKNAFKGNSQFSTWLYSITFNHCVSSMKRKKKNRTESYESIPSFISDENDMEMIEDRQFREEREALLFKALDEIPEQDKILLELKYQNNYSVKQIETELNLSKSAIKMRLMRARQKVGKHYQKVI